MNISKKSAGLLIGLGLITGGAVTIGLQSKAQTTTTDTTATAQSTTPDRQFDPSRGGHIGSNGTKETLLTGDTAEKVKAAALVAVPGGTIQRVENDAEGAVYEAHMTKSDGSAVTVKLDASFNVTGTETGFGGRK